MNCKQGIVHCEYAAWRAGITHSPAIDVKQFERITLEEKVSNLKMKIITIFLIAAGVLSTAGNADAVDVSAGVSTWYTGWKYKDSTGTHKIDPAFMVGPMVSFGFNRTWSWANVLMYGRFKMDRPSYNETTGEETTEESTFTRFDIDSTLNYNFNRYLKFFGGFKYSRHGSSGLMFHTSMGPAVGIGLTVPLSDYFFVVGTFSGIVMMGKEKPSGMSSYNSVDSGFNSTLSLAYYFDSIATTILAGGRYQYIKSRYDDDASSGGSISDTTVQYYGIVVSAVHTFDFSSDSE